MVYKPTRKELLELIESMEAASKDATELRREMDVLGPEVESTPQTRRNSRFREEEETTEERLARRVGDLFPNTIPLEAIEDYDYRFTLKELRTMCKEAGLSVSGDKKELAAKLIAKGGRENLVTEREDLVDLGKYRKWEGKPDEVTIPEVYLKDLHFEIVVFVRKERGGSDFTFQCCEYNQTADGQWRFFRVIQDSSKLNPGGKVVRAVFAYHPEVLLVNVAFMVYPNS